MGNVNNEQKDSRLTIESFEKLIEDIFPKPNHSKKRMFICDAGFIQGYYDKYGKKGLISLCNNCEVTTGEEGYNLIVRLIK